MKCNWKIKIAGEKYTNLWLASIGGVCTTWMHNKVFNTYDHPILLSLLSLQPSWIINGIAQVWKQVESKGILPYHEFNIMKRRILPKLWHNGCLLIYDTKLGLLKLWHKIGFSQTMTQNWVLPNYDTKLHCLHYDEVFPYYDTYDSLPIIRSGLT